MYTLKEFWEKNHSRAIQRLIDQPLHRPYHGKSYFFSVFHLKPAA